MASSPPRSPPGRAQVQGRSHRGFPRSLHRPGMAESPANGRSFAFWRRRPNTRYRREMSLPDSVGGQPSSVRAAVGCRQATGTCDRELAAERHVALKPHGAGGLAATASQPRSSPLPLPMNPPLSRQNQTIDHDALEQAVAGIQELPLERRDLPRLRFDVVDTRARTLRRYSRTPPTAQG